MGGLGLFGALLGEIDGRGVELLELRAALLELGDPGGVRILANPWRCWNARAERQQHIGSAARCLHGVLKVPFALFFRAPKKIF